DVWLRLRPLAYKEHPYQWATIGKDLSHIENAKIEDVKAFFKKHYNPKNAILVVAGDVKTEEIKTLAEKWFEPIPAGERYTRNLPIEPKQLEARREIVKADVPTNSIYMAFHMPSRKESGYYIADLISDLLSQGQSSRLYRRLLKEQEIFSEINAYITGSIDAGLLVIEGKPLPEVSMEVAEVAIWEELEKMRSEYVLDYELEKVKNKTESTMVFSELSVLNKAMNFAYFELLGDANLINEEISKYLSVTAEDIRTLSEDLFRKENSSTLIYLSDTHA